MSEYHVDRARWAQLPIIEQMAHVYSEVGRSLAARRSGDLVGQGQARSRAIDLLDATVETLPKGKSFRAKEILRAKEQYLQLFDGDTLDAAAANGLERYFFTFAIAARRGR